MSDQRLQKIDTALDAIRELRSLPKEDPKRINSWDLPTIDYVISLIETRPESTLILDPSVLYPFHLNHNQHEDSKETQPYVANFIGDGIWHFSMDRIINILNFAFKIYNFKYSPQILDLVEPNLRNIELKGNQKITSIYQERRNRVLKDLRRSHFLGENGDKHFNRSIKGHISMAQRWEKELIEFSNLIGQDTDKLRQSFMVCTTITEISKKTPIEIIFADSRSRKAKFYHTIIEFIKVSEVQNFGYRGDFSPVALHQYHPDPNDFSKVDAIPGRVQDGSENNKFLQELSLYESDY